MSRSPRLITRSAGLSTDAQCPPADRTEAPGGKRQRPARRVVGMALAFLSLLLTAPSLCGAKPKVKTIPLYRLCLGGWAPVHFYVVNANERDSAVKNIGYKYDGIAGYVLPPSQKPTSDLVPFYRLAKLRPRPDNLLGPQGIHSVDHFCTANPAEVQQAVRDGWTLDGVMCLIASRQLPGTAPLHRLHKIFEEHSVSDRQYQVAWEHLYTADEAEYFAAIHKHQYQDEGVSGYIWLAEVEVNISGKPTFKVTRKK